MQSTELYPLSNQFPEVWAEASWIKILHFLIQVQLFGRGKMIYCRKRYAHCLPLLATPRCGKLGTRACWRIRSLQQYPFHPAIHAVLLSCRNWQIALILDWFHLSLSPLQCQTQKNTFVGSAVRLLPNNLWRGLHLPEMCNWTTKHYFLRGSGLSSIRQKFSKVGFWETGSCESPDSAWSFWSVSRLALVQQRFGVHLWGGLQKSSSGSCVAHCPGNANMVRPPLDCLVSLVSNRPNTEIIEFC